MLLEELGYACAATPFLGSALAALAHPAAGPTSSASGCPARLGRGDGRASAGSASCSPTPRAPTWSCSSTPTAPASLVDGRRRSSASTRSTRPAATAASTGGGRVAAATSSAAVDRALVAVAAELVGVCQRALDMTLDYVKERKQFGVPVGTFQAVQHRAAQMLLDTEGARSATYFAAWAADAEPDRLGRSPRRRPRRGVGRAARDVTAARDPAARRHRLHVGGRRPLAVQARAARRRAARRRGRTTARASHSWCHRTAPPPRPDTTLTTLEGSDPSRVKVGGMEASARPEGIAGSNLAGPFPVGAYAAQAAGRLRSARASRSSARCQPAPAQGGEGLLRAARRDGALPCSMWRDDFEQARCSAGALADGAQVVVGRRPRLLPRLPHLLPVVLLRRHRACGSPARATCSPSSRRCGARSPPRGCSSPRSRCPPGAAACIGVVTGEGGKARDDVLAGLHRRGWAGRAGLGLRPRPGPPCRAADRPGAAGPRRDRRGRGHRRRARRRLARRPLRVLRRDAVPDGRAAAHAGARLGRPPHRPHR